MARQLYEHLAAFVTENLAHMTHEEREHNRVLWETHSDDEIRAIEAAVIYLCLGVALGVYMGASHDHSLAAVHAHIN